MFFVGPCLCLFLVLACSFFHSVVQVGGSHYLESAFMHKFLQNHYGDRPLAARAKNKAPVRSPRNNGHAMLTPESNWSERSNHELARAQFPVYGSRKSLPLYHTSGSPGRMVYSTVNGSLHPSERAVEIGLIGNLPVDGLMLERSGQKNYGPVLAQNPSGSIPLQLQAMQSPKAVVGMNQDRYGVYHHI